MVQIRTAPIPPGSAPLPPGCRRSSPGSRRSPSSPPALAVGERRTLLAAAAARPPAAGLLGFSQWSLGVLEAERRDTARQLARRTMNEQGATAGQLLAELGPARGSRPTRAGTPTSTASRGALITAAGHGGRGPARRAVRARRRPADPLGRRPRRWSRSLCSPSSAWAGPPRSAATRRVPGRLRLHRCRRCSAWSSCPSSRSSTASPCRSPTPTSTTPNNPFSRSGSGSTTSSTSWATSTIVRSGRRKGWSATTATSTGRWASTIVWTVANVAIGVTLGLLLALAPQHQGARAAADLPRAPDPPVGGAQLHHAR